MSFRMDDLKFLANTADDMSISSFSHPDDVNVAEVAEAAVARIEALEAALQTSEAWLNRWAAHVGKCRGGGHCECGLTAARFEAEAALTSDPAGDVDHG